MKNIPIRQINPTGKGPEFSQRFRIRTVKELLGGNDMVQALHRHNFFFILMLDKGEGNHAIDFIPYQVNDHCVFIMRPGQVHELTLKAGSTGYLMEFDREFYHGNGKGTNRVLLRASNTNFCQITKEAFKTLRPVLSYILREANNQQHGYEDIIKANLAIFFTELVRHRQPGNSPANLASPPYVQERLDEFLALLETHVSGHKQVAEYAEMLNISVFQLNSITKAALGKTASGVINDYMILESKRYLLATTDQVNQIAYHLGYEDPSYFIRFFKKHTGYSPVVFRSNYK